MNSVNANPKIDLSKMGIFADVHLQGDVKHEDGIVQLRTTATGKQLTYGGDRSLKEWHKRTDVDVMANNAVRTELLKSLGDALGIKGYRKDTYKGVSCLKFSKDFIRELKKALGAEGLDILKLGNFDVEDNGFVKSGKPLTERRLTLLNRFLATRADPNVERNQTAINNLARPSQKLQAQFETWIQQHTNTTTAYFSKFKPADKNTDNEFHQSLKLLLPNALKTEGAYDLIKTSILKKAVNDLITSTDSITIDRALTDIYDAIGAENEHRTSRGEALIKLPEPNNFESWLKDQKNALKNSIKSRINIFYPDPNKKDLLNSDVDAKSSIEDLLSYEKKILSTPISALYNTTKENCVQLLTVLGNVTKLVKPGNAALNKLQNLKERISSLTDIEENSSPAALSEMVFGHHKQPSGAKIEHLLTCAKFFLEDFDKLNTTDWLFKEDEQKENKIGEFKQSVRTALRDAFRNLSKFFCIASNPPNESELISDDSINEKLSWKKAEAQVPDKLPLYPTSKAASSTKLFANLLTAYQRVPTETQEGKLMKQAKELATKDGRSTPDVVDFLNCVTTYPGEMKKSAPTVRFAHLLKYDLVSCESFDKSTSSDKLVKPLKEAIKSIPATIPREEQFDALVKSFIDNCKQIPGCAKWDANKSELVQNVKNALVTGLHIHRSTVKDDKTPDNFSKALARNGGGLNSIHEREFTLDDDQFKNAKFQSVVTPMNQLLNTYKVAISPDDPPLANLAKSELKDENGKALITFNRFGVVGTDAHSKASIKEHYRQLTIQTFLANPNLLKKAQDGGTTPVDVPIWRVDLASHNKLNFTDNEDQITYTFKMTIPNGPTIDVTLKPKVHHFHMPIDNAPNNGDPLIGQTFSGDNAAALEALKNAAEKFPNDDAIKKKAVDELLKQIKDGFGAIKELEKTNTAEELVDLEYGPILTRLGARIAVLTSLLGNVPSINCNWGRDRTGAMDNECKLVALKVNNFIAKNDLNAAFITPVLLEKGKEDPDIELRTKLLEETGNQDIARATNCTLHPINDHQSMTQMEVDGHTKDVPISGFYKLFKKSA